MFQDAKETVMSPGWSFRKSGCKTGGQIEWEVRLGGKPSVIITTICESKTRLLGANKEKGRGKCRLREKRIKRKGLWQWHQDIQTSLNLL